MKRRVMRNIAVALVATCLAAAVTASASPETCTNTNAFCFAPHVTKRLDTFDRLTLPTIAVPDWLGVAP